jgi:hypothetical protein
VFAREFYWRRFVQGIWATAPMRDYCVRHRLPYLPKGSGPPTRADEWAGLAAFYALPAVTRDALEAEARRANELATPAGNAFLLEAGGDGPRPPPDVPAGEAVALWYLVHRPDLFAAAFARFRSVAAGTWRVGTAPAGLKMTGLERRAAALAAALHAAHPDVPPDAPPAVHAYPAPHGWVFEAEVCGRPHRLTGFSERGTPVVVDARPASAVVFTYDPADGSVRLYSRLRSRSRADALFAAFGTSVLRSPVTPAERAYALDRLKAALPLPPDAPDMTGVRVKALTLAYPPDRGGRRLALDTPPGDRPEAVYDLLREHVDGLVLDELGVTHAELEVELRDGPARRRVPVLLWPDGCSLGPDAAGRRLLRCLSAWGLGHA